MSVLKPLNIAFDVPTLPKFVDLTHDLSDEFNDRLITAKLGLGTFAMLATAMITPKSDEQAIANLMAIRKTFDIFNGQIGIDLKMGDIDNTLVNAVGHLNHFTPEWINFHAVAGSKALRAARNAMNSDILALVVTVLTSIKDECTRIYGGNAENVVPRLALLGKEAGMNGTICSGLEVAMLTNMSAMAGSQTLVPGGKLKITSSDRDHARSLTYEEIIRGGATGVVAGRDVYNDTEGRSPAKMAGIILDIVNKAKQ